jgi:hypothetical protein
VTSEMFTLMLTMQKRADARGEGGDGDGAGSREDAALGVPGTLALGVGSSSDSYI